MTPKRSYPRVDFNYCEVESLKLCSFLNHKHTLVLLSLIAVDFADKLGIHCVTCLRNISSAACRLLDNGTISCVKCKENFKDDLLCSNCAASFDNNETTLQGSCDACMCNIHASHLTDPCDQGNHKCFVCRSNGTSLNCKGCPGNDHNVNSFIKNCAMEKEKVEAKNSGTFLNIHLFMHNSVHACTCRDVTNSVNVWFHGISTPNPRKRCASLYFPRERGVS